MRKGEDFQLEDTIRRSMEILEEVESLDARSPEGSTDRARSLAFEEDLSALQDDQVPGEGRVEVSLSTDLMSATASFFPPVGLQPSLAESDVNRALKAKGVCIGVEEKAIREALHKCNSQLVVLSRVIVARGRPARNEVPPFLQIVPELLSPLATPDISDASVDFKSWSPFRLIRKGEVLARLVPKHEGELGFNVRGEAIPFDRTEVAALKPGPNTGLKDDALVALRDGHLQMHGDTITVNEVLDVTGDVDYRTGHIDFPGAVVIHGEVKQGFKVKAGGSVFCARVIDATELYCQGDLVTEQGILGRGTGIVRVGGSITTRFIENCMVEAQGTIQVRTGCLNSILRTLDRVLTGPKGMLVGGKIYAQEGIQAAQVGTATSPRTELICGINVFVQQKLLWIRDKNMALATRLKQVQTRMEADPGSRSQLQDVHDRLRSAIHRLNESARELAGELDKNERAFVQVNGPIYPGAYIEICHIPFVVTETYSGVRFSLDKKKGRIVVDPLL